MDEKPEDDTVTLEIAQRWCASQGAGWTLGQGLGKGGTAPVFEVFSPEGPRALKIYDEKFCTGRLGDLERMRVRQQLALKGHDCPYLVPIYDGGTTHEGRLFLLMGRAPGTELEKRLKFVPRSKMRQIVDQITRAALFLRERGFCHRDIKAANIFISDDFEHSTLLDVSVVRAVHDPMGIGTDHEGQLPVVATARYSPPEYLFRLVEPSPELWHALTVYQMGGLLHDLIMQQPLFEAEYRRSTQNRYRFAWIVATSIPEVASPDVEQDLIVTARRALDKDWLRRRELKLEDFLAEPPSRKAYALGLLGIGRNQRAVPAADADLSANVRRIKQIAAAINTALVSYLRENDVTPKHAVNAGPDDLACSIALSWLSEEPDQRNTVAVTFEVVARITYSQGNSCIQLSLELTEHRGSTHSAAMLLPEVLDRADIEAALSTQCIAALGMLAMQVVRHE